MFSAVPGDGLGALEHTHIHDPKLKESYPPPAAFSRTALIKSVDEYHDQFGKSISDPDAFWTPIAEGFEWSEKVGR